MSELNELIQYCEDYISAHGIDEKVIKAYVDTCRLAKGNEDKDGLLKCTERTKQIINQFCKQEFDCDIWTIERAYQSKGQQVEFVNTYYEVLKMESYWRFESFIYYMERNRNWSKRFYYPRRKTLGVVVKDLEDLENRVIKFYGLSMPARSGKSTVCIFFLAWIALKRPNSHSAMGGHSGILAKGFYKELMNLFVTAEYTFNELFAYWHPKYADKPLITDKSADEFTVTLGDPDRFATVTCRGIDGTWTGAVDVSSDGYLYVDDLVRDREHSLSPTRMENTYQEYLNKMVDRKNDGARELMVGTLWSVYDPLQRIRIQNENNPKYRFRKIPALDENDESNFQYEINGFSTAYYREMREKLDKAEWMAKFQQQPFVREGLVFPNEELRLFANDNVLPNGKYRVVAICDPAFGGGDSLSMPICVDHENGKKYIIDWVFNKGTQKITVPLIIDKITKHGILEVVLEKNAGGELLKGILEEELRKQGYFGCKITTRPAPNNMSKDDKIVAYSDYIKDNFIFLLPNYELPQDDMVERYIRSAEYDKAIEELCIYTSEGKNIHDDAPDSMAQLAMFFEHKQRRKAVIMSSPI